MLRFAPRERALSPDEIGLMYEYLDKVSAGPMPKVACMLLLTMVRKGELTDAKWSEISFTDALWTIPKERMKRRNPHLVFLSRQALDIFIALKTFAGGSEWVLPSRYDADADEQCHAEPGAGTGLYDGAEGRQGTGQVRAARLAPHGQHLAARGPGTTRTGSRNALPTNRRA